VGSEEGRPRTKRPPKFGKCRVDRTKKLIRESPLLWEDTKGGRGRSNKEGSYNEERPRRWKDEGKVGGGKHQIGKDKTRGTNEKSWVKKRCNNIKKISEKREERKKRGGGRIHREIRQKKKM